METVLTNLKSAGNKIEFFPEHYYEADGKLFFLHKDSSYIEKYFIENNFVIDFVLFDYNRLFYFSWLFNTRINTGKQREEIIFDPRDVRLGITPVLGFRMSLLDLNLGLDHFCFHEIDRKIGESEYWNKFFIEGRTKNFLLRNYRQKLQEVPVSCFYDRLSGVLRLGNYAKAFFGKYPDVMISGGHDFEWETALESRYAFFIGKKWLLNSHTWFNLCVNEKGNVYQTYVLGLETHFLNGKNGTSFFMDYFLRDDLTVRNKDKLLEAGIRVYL
jgi:hypothetical protein